GLTGPATELSLAVLLNDEDPDGDVLEVRQVTQPLHGQVTIEPDGTLSYLPKKGYTGSDQFRYWVTDGSVDVPALVELEVAPESAADPLLFPATIDDGTAPFDHVYVGLALLNAQDRFEQLQIRAFGGDGREVAAATHVGSLPPKGQEAFLTSELRDPKGQAQYIAATNFTQDLQGMLVVGDYNSRRMDGIGARPAAGRQLYIPEVLMAADAQTFLQLINREARAGSIDLELYDGKSRRPARWSGTIQPSGSLRGLVSDFFGYTDGFQGFVKVVSDVDLSGIAVSAGSEWISTAPTMVPRSSRTWTAPHIFADRNGGDTFIRILNTSLLDASGDLTIFNDAGQVVSSRRLFIPAQKLTVMAASQLFGGLLDIKGIISGSMVLTLDGNVPPPQVALVTYVTPKARTTVPLLREGETNATFPQVAHSKDEGIFTGLAIFNPSSATAHVTLEVYDAGGRQTARLELSLPPKAREAGLLGEPELFGPDFEQIRGHIRIRSDRPVFSYITFGDQDGETLSALEPQPNHQ
ncbi:MAG: Ig-like domain-containing protein, partial [Acidobacteriota bacterium]